MERIGRVDGIAMATVNGELIEGTEDALVLAVDSSAVGGNLTDNDLFLVLDTAPTGAKTIIPWNPGPGRSTMD